MNWHDAAWFRLSKYDLHTNSGELSSHAHINVFRVSACVKAVFLAAKVV